MTVRTRPALPAGHGELVTRPAFSEWPALALRNHAAADALTFSVAGVDGRVVRKEARAQALVAAEQFSAKLGVPVDPPRGTGALIVATGHQPELYHPGVWVKDFLLQRIADDLGASAVDVVVDSDAFGTVGLTAPCLAPEVRRCTEYLAVGSQETCFACAPVPAPGALADFCGGGADMLAALPAPAVAHHFAAFCDVLPGAASVAENLGEFVTIARRRYEAPAGTRYLELPATSMIRTDAYLAFVADIALSAERFASAYNAELAEFRLVNGTRSPAQPFPDLLVESDRVELPIWQLSDGARSTVWAEPHPGGVRLVSESGDRIADLPSEGSEAGRVLAEAGVMLAPKAVLLTLYVRVFVSDLFVHGIGGGRYDAVTDGVCRRYYGIEPPPFVVASLTMYLPLGAQVVTDEEVAAAKERLNRLDHNPDALLGEVEFDTEEERHRAVDLAAQKATLVAAIGEPDADKKELGKRIRVANTDLAAMLAPLRSALERDVKNLEAQKAASEILTDRTYPFCLWSPMEVADKAR